jgi:RHS repeat-associated protein
MKIGKVILFITFLFLNISFVFSQKQNEYPAWGHPLLKALEKKAANLITFNHDSDDIYFIPLAILNKNNARLYYINTFGFVFDSLPVGPILMKELTTKKKDAFEVYLSLVTTECLKELEEIKRLIRENKLDSTKLARRKTYFNYTLLNNTASSFEQLTLLASIEKQVWQNYQLLNLVLTEKTDAAFLHKKTSWNFFEPCKIKLHGEKQMDSVEFTACNRFSRLYKAVLKPATATIYMLNREQQVVDSFTVMPDKMKDLTADKQDVFALYRMWLEWQLENTGKQINKLAIIKEAKFDPESMTEAQLKRLDTLLRFASYTEKKISYATRPDKDLLLINLLQQCKTTPHKNWATATQQWQDVPMPLPADATLSTFTRGEKEYFLTDHRGNVMATVSDRKMQVDNNNDGIVDYYIADVVTATDYAPFGSLLTGRTYRNNGQQLKYGYNGKENDNDVKGEGNQQDYGFRIYDPRLGKFLSVDPIAKNYPELTPYQFASNSPISGVDLDGKEFSLSITDPTVSENFMRTWESGDVYGARKIVFDAIHNKVSKAVINNVNDNSTTISDGETLKPKGKINILEGAFQAYLSYNPNIQGLEISMNRGQGYPYYAKTKTDFTWIWEETRTMAKTEGHNGYPVDVRVINSPEFKNFYGEDDFKGSYKIKYGSSGLSKSPIGIGVGRGIISGQMKGYGLVNYDIEMFGLSSTGLGLEIGGLNGKFNIKDYSPSTLAGYGASYAGGGGIGVSFTKGKWYSFSSLDDMLKLRFSNAAASGTQNSMSVGFPFKPGYTLSGSAQYSISTLKELPKPK